MSLVSFVALPGAVVMRCGPVGDCCLQEMAADEALAVARALLNAVERAIAAQARMPADLIRGELA